MALCRFNIYPYGLVDVIGHPTNNLFSVYMVSLYCASAAIIDILDLWSWASISIEWKHFLLLLFCKMFQLISHRSFENFVLCYFLVNFCLASSNLLLYSRQCFFNNIWLLTSLFLVRVLFLIAYCFFH